MSWRNSHFIGGLASREIDRAKSGRRRFELLWALGFYSARLDKVITSPKGSRTDFASVPWPVSLLIKPTTRRLQKASVIHDWAFLHNRTDDGGEIGRWNANVLFYDALKVEGVIWPVRAAMFAFLHFSNGPQWKRRRNP